MVMMGQLPLNNPDFCLVKVSQSPQCLVGLGTTPFAIGDPQAYNLSVNNLAEK